MILLLAAISVAFFAGFGGGYVVRDQISWRRHREAARLRTVRYRGDPAALEDRSGGASFGPAMSLRHREI